MTPAPESAGEGHFSVIIPAHNASGTIPRAIDSVLDQGRCVGQIIVVDDGSKDGTADIVAGYPSVELIQQPQSGVAAARNRGLLAATCPYIALIDADDCWGPGKLETQLRILESHPDVGLVFTNFVNVDEQGNRLAGFDQHPGVFAVRARRDGDMLLFDTDVFAGLCADLFVATSTVAIRHSCIDQVGLFDLRRVAEDMDYWLRLALITRFAADVRVLVYKANRPDSLGADSQQVMVDTADLLEGFPDRFSGLNADQRRALRRRLGEIQYSLAYKARKSGDRVKAMKLQFKSLVNQPSLLSLLEIGKLLALR